MNKLTKIIRLVGVGMLLCALLLMLYNLWDDYRAAEQAETAEASLRLARQQSLQAEQFQLPQTEEYQLPFYEEFPDVQMPVITLNGTDYVGTLEIPSKSLSLSVIDTWSYPNLKKSPCRYSGSAYRGDLILCAHNYSTHFGCLASLEPGTSVVFTDCDGNVFRYEVTEMVILPPDGIEEMQKGDWDLTLFTCTLGGATRVTVRCNLVESVPAGEEKLSLNSAKKCCPLCYGQHFL